ncbi:MAG: phosphoribosyltransferase [Acidobacteria bacterium]|nr:phosphoribosyltransferase [Acidobacteriota bacterium]
MRPFRDRTIAGKVLAASLKEYVGKKDVVVLGLARGGVPVAYEVAQALRAPLDVFIVRKLGTPGQSELAMGALASGGIRVMNDDVFPLLGLTDEELNHIVTSEQRELERRERAYRGDRPALKLRGKTVILVDDGIATGTSMRAAVQAIIQMNPAKLVVAVPVAAPESCAEFNHESVTCVCVETPQPFHAVGLWYDNFAQTTDKEVCALLAKANERALQTSKVSAGI